MDIWTYNFVSYFTCYYKHLTGLSKFPMNFVCMNHKLERDKGIIPQFKIVKGQINKYSQHYI